MPGSKPILRGVSVGPAKDAARPHLCGYTDALGEAYSHLETNAYTGKIEDYQRVQYDRLFDGGAAAALYQG